MHSRESRLKSLFLVLLLASLALAGARADTIRLPNQAPVPQSAPQRQAAITPSDVGLIREAAIPLPQPRPARPDEARPNRNRALGEMFGPPVPDKMLPDPRSNAKQALVMPTEESACRARLKALGAEFEDLPAQSSAKGCALPFPIKLERLSATIDIAPDAIVNCATAEASALFAVKVIAPAAKAEFNEDLASVSQASGYVCRPRNGTKKLSEHAFGNALDISSFVLSKGTRINVEAAAPAKELEFLAMLRKAACGPFKTVLGPGSDADHALHFHFDLAPRRNGGTFCQ